MASWVAHYKCSINHAFYSISVGVEFLLSRDEFDVLELVLILSWQKHLVEPCGDVIDCAISIYLNLLFRLAQLVQQQQLTFYGIFDDLLDNFLAEVHLGQDILEDAMNDVAEDKGVVHIARVTLKLV